MKYVITKDFDQIPPYKVRIFSEGEQHSEVYDEMMGKRGTLHGAGFCRPTLSNLSDNDLIWFCFGESTSLRMKADQDRDGSLLNACVPCEP